MGETLLSLKEYDHQVVKIVNHIYKDKPEHQKWKSFLLNSYKYRLITYAAMADKNYDENNSKGAKRGSYRYMCVRWGIGEIAKQQVSLKNKRTNNPVIKTEGGRVDHLEDVADKQPDPAMSALEKEQKKQAQKKLLKIIENKKLSHTRQIILALAHISGLSISQIARQLALKVTKVRDHLKKSYQILRCELQDAEDEIYGI